MRAVFLDKDGTLIEDVPYNIDPERIRLTPGAAEGLYLLHVAGYRLIVISNQSGVARGYFPEKALRAVEGRVRELLAEFEVPLTAFYYCPHHPAGVVPRYSMACDCRKPAPGLLLRAAREHNIDLAQSWLIGDILDDIEAGRRAGCATVLLDNGHETEWALSRDRLPHHLTSDLAAAALLITTEGGLAPRIPRGRWTTNATETEDGIEHQSTTPYRKFLPPSSAGDWRGDYR